MKNLSAFWAAAAGVAVGIVLFAVLGAGTIEDSGIFQSLKLGGRTNLVSDDNVDLTYNGAHYQRSVPILNNLTNGNGTNLTSLLASAVQAGQTNANPYISEPVYTMTGDQTLTYTNSRQLLIWNSTTNCTVTFADGATNGWNVSLKALGAGNLILTNTAGKTFDGFTSVTQSGDIILHWAADGTNYRSGRSSPKTFVSGNTVYASPADGSTNPAVMRALVTKDLAAGIVADTNLANPKLSLTGGTVSGPVLTTSSSSNAPASTELATGGWVRSLLQNGSVLYTSTNVATVGWDTNAFYYQSTIPVPGGRSYTPAAGDYFGSSITTNTYLQVNGPITVSTYFTSTGGAGNSAYTVHPEIYFTYALTNTSLTIGDYVAQSQTLVHGAVTNRYDFVIAFPPYISTNSTGFYIVRRWKVDTKTGTDTLTLSLGTNTPSQIGFTVPASVGANWVASGTADSTLSGVATVGGLVNNGTTVHTPSAIQTLSTNSTIAVNASTLRVTGNGAAVTLTNLPSIATNNIADGTVITVRGTSDANTVTLQDYRTLTGTCLAMEVGTVTLKNGSEMRFQWSAGNQRWQAMAFSANSSQNHPFKDATATGWFTGSAYDYNAPATLTPVDAGVSIDFGAANRLASITLTGAVTFAFANQTAGRAYELFILGCSTNSPITWPTVSGIYPAGVYPSVAAAGKWHHLKFKCITSSVTTNIYIDGSTSN